MGKVYTDVTSALKNYQTTDLISFPTDTVYGIGASPFCEQAILKIYQTKHRPINKPLAILCANKQQILEIVSMLPENIEKLIDAFMPGALTVILPKKSTIPDFVTGNLQTVGVRIPNHPIALEILKQVGPLATTSANLSGEQSLTNGESVIKELGEDIDIIINGGVAEIGVPSTVIAIQDGKIKIIREGSINKTTIEAILNQ